MSLGIADTNTRVLVWLLGCVALALVGAALGLLPMLALGGAMTYGAVST